MFSISGLCLQALIITSCGLKAFAQNTDCIFQDSKCYSISEEILDFADAEEVCQHKGAILAAPVSRNLLVILATEMDKRKLSLIWVGLHDRLQEGKWLYSNGTAMEPPSFPIWNKQQPDSAYSEEDCAVMDSNNAKLNDERCSNKYAFVCESPVIDCNLQHIQIKHAIFDHCRQDIHVPHDTKVKIKCVDNFVRKGPESVTCVNGQWTTSTNCTVQCNPPELPMSVTLVQPSDFYYSGDQVPIICHDGFFTYDERPTSHWNITCTDEGTWNPPEVVCSPASQFIYSQKSQIKNIIKVQVGQSVNLPCIQPNPPQEAFTYMWMRNQLDLTNHTVSNPKKYQVSNDGSFTLNTFSDTDQGLYMCFLRNRRVILPGQVIFSLKRASPCGKPFPTNIAEVQEGASALLTCVKYDSQSSTAPVWLKNEARVWNRKHLTVLINGGLLIGNITFTDAGEYKCQYVDDLLCSRNITTKLIVIPSSKNMCGLTTYNTHPWIVSLWWDEDEKPFCYGAILNTRWIISSAVCMFGLSQRNLNGIYVQLNVDKGEIIVNEIGSRRPTARISTFVIHPDFSMRMRSASLALVQLDQPLKFTHIFFPVCVANEALLPNIKKVHQNPCHPASGLQGYAGGMGNLGKTGDGKFRSGNAALQHFTKSADFEDVTIGMGAQCITSTCTKAPSQVMCARSDKIPPSYITDTGSPLYIKNNHRSYLVGVLNWVEDSGNEPMPDYYTSIIPYAKWIQTIIEGQTGRLEMRTIAEEEVGQEDETNKNTSSDPEKSAV